MNITTSTLSRWLLVSIPLLVLPGLLWLYWPQPREAVYSIYRERGKVQTLEALDGYRSKSSDHFEVLFTDQDRNVADLILETAEAVYEPVIKQVGYRPEGKVPLIVYPSRDELRHAFGWGNGESAMGVYWSGTIRLLSPNVWIDEKGDREQRKVFRKLNPIAHELTHYVLDYLTNGNYPRWFTEGLAQRVEYKVTGFLWVEPESTLRQDLYTLNDLQERFDQLKNQPLAYRQSYLLVEYMARTYGDESLTELVCMLGEGKNFHKSLEASMGTSVSLLFDDWQEWVNDHVEQLDPAS